MKKNIYKIIGPEIRNWIRTQISLEQYDIRNRQKANPFFEDDPYKNYHDSEYKLGIIIDDFQYHQHFIAACRDLQVSYVLINITDNSWVQTIQNSKCDGFLVWPSIRNTIVKNMFDDRLAFMVNEMGKIIYPSLKECWIYENKLRTAYWLKINDIAHPETSIFYKKQEAVDFVKQTSFPIVFKSYLGATASGVKILKEKAEALKLINQLFKKGFLPRGHNKYDKQRGFIIFQEFLKDIKEWRMVRIGDSFFGYQKMQIGDFHSGSHEILLEEPSDKLLWFLKEVTDKGNFTSMDVDVFETASGNLYVNELQTVFGTTSLIKAVNQKPEMNVRYFLDNNQWKSEQGDFFRNGFCNMRVNELLSILKKQ